MGKRSRKKDHSNFRGQKSPVTAKKYLGQHFLKDENIAAKIADTLSYKDYKQIVEIGPGTGMLTKYLLTKSVRIIAMEVDAESVAYLRENYQGELEPNLEVLQADFLKFDLVNQVLIADCIITGVQIAEYSHLGPQIEARFHGFNFCQPLDYFGQGLLLGMFS